ncbi:MAG: pyruvate dehydrogenase (acetyl-transferring) E1 component subunit alpha [bacterium]
MTRVATFEVHYTRLIDRDGRPTQPLPPLAEDRDAMVEMYRAMVLTRTFDTRAIALQRTGRLGTYASSLGQEAIAVGVGVAMTPADVLLPYARDHGAQLLRGVTLTELFLFWGGDERGSNFATPRQDFPVTVPIATHLPHAAGAAMAFKLRGERRAAVCLCGDGATSKGDFYEGLNLAGVWQVPAVFVVCNNAWAISMPRAAQTAAETLAQKAFAAGMSCEQVDGNDVVAVRIAMEAALTRARAGEGPHLIEAITYRLADHTTADDASRYRDDEVVGAHWEDDPIKRIKAYLVDQMDWSKEEEEAVIAACSVEVEAAAEAYLAIPPQPVEAIFDFMYETLPTDLAAQRDALLKEVTRRG